MSDKKYNPIEFLTGFLMGVLGGIGLEFLLLFAYNWIAAWQGWAPFEPAWWMALPIPAFFGVMMGQAIASLHLEDY